MLESGKICGFWADVVEKAGNSTEIYRILAEKTGKEIIVDSTKFGRKSDDSIKFGGFYDGLGEYSTLFIHMYKPIEEYAASCIRYGLEDINWIISSWCSRNEVNGMQIDYRKFVEYPEKYLLRICDVLKIEYRVLTNFWHTDEHHLLAGNDGVLAFYHPQDFNGKSTDALNMRPDSRKNFRKIFYDPDRWKEVVTSGIQHLLWDNPEVRRISGQLGLERL